MSFDKIIPELLPVADLRDMWSTNKLTTPAGVMSVQNVSQATVVEPNTNFNDMVINGVWNFVNGIYINQPPVTVDGTNLMAGFLTVTVDNNSPTQAIFQEYKVWQAGADTGKVFTRGWHGLIGSWGNWVSGGSGSNGESSILGTSNRIVAFNHNSAIAHIFDDNGQDVWTTINLPVSGYWGLRNLFYLPSGRLVIIQSNFSLISDDRGKTWREVVGPVTETLRTARGIVTLGGRILVSTTTAADGGLLLISDDGGESWTNITSEVNITLSTTVLSHMTLTRTGRIIILSGSVGSIYSDDDGITWNSVTAIVGSSPSTTLVLPSNKLIFINNSTHVCVYSNDNGESWTTGNPIGTTKTIDTLSRTPTGRIIGLTRTSATSKEMVYSDDDGETWTMITFDAPASASFYSPIFSLESGRLITYPYHTTGYFCYSDDDGLTWSYELLSMNFSNMGATILVPSASSIANMDHIMCVQEKVASGVSGGTFTSAEWRTRGLNVVTTNTIKDAFFNINSSTVVLPAGRYYIDATATAYAVSIHQARIYNNTNNFTLLLGETAYQSAGNTSSKLSGIINLSVSTEIALQHRSSSTRADNGLGMAASFGESNIFSQVIIRRLS